MTRERSESILFGVAAAVASFGRHWGELGRPFGLDLEGVMGGRFQAAFCKAWDSAGFFALGGRPILTPIPTIPLSGELYANHPPLYHWISYLFFKGFGRDEFALRLYPALCCALLGFLVVSWVRELTGRTGALAALALFVAAPMVTVYGAMANYESPLILLTFAAYRLLPERRIGRGRGALVALLMFLAVAQDWPALFSLPAILAVRLAERRPFLREMLWLGGGAAAALVSYGLLLVSWKGGFAETGAALDIALHSGRESKPWSLAALIEAQHLHLRRGYGWPLIAALLFAIVGAFRLRIESLRRGLQVGLAWCLAALCYVLAFPARAMDHEFCWFYPVAGLLLVVAIACESLVAALGRPRIRVVLAVVLLAVVTAGGLEAESVRPKKPIPALFFELIEQANVIAGEDTMVLTPRVYAGAWFYMQAWIVENVTDPQDVERGILRFKQGEYAVDHLVVELSSTHGPVIDRGPLLKHGGKIVAQGGFVLWMLDR